MKYSGIIMIWFNKHDLEYSTATTEVDYTSYFELTTNIPYHAPMNCLSVASVLEKTDCLLCQGTV